VQPPAPKAANAHRLLQVSLIPVAAKYVARRSADAGRMVEFVGGPYIPEAVPAEYLAILRRLLVQYRDDAPEEMLAPSVATSTSPKPHCSRGEPVATRMRKGSSQAAP
jgi:hypothetical protein